METKDQLEEISRLIRRDIIELCSRTGSGHVGPSLSVVEILVVLYQNIIKGTPPDPDRDRVILSKGHACPALYAVLAYKGWITAERLKSFAINGSLLGHHPHWEPEIGLEANTGSLGHGLSIGCGLALAAKKMCSLSRTFVILSDGETNEGSVWEAAGFAAHHHLNNLCMILDANGIQAMGYTKDILNPINHAAKWKAFGWETIEIDGHNVLELNNSLSKIGLTRKPLAIIAHTVKGKGISFMENNILWHYRCPKGKEYELAMKELT